MALRYNIVIIIKNYLLIASGCAWSCVRHREAVITALWSIIWRIKARCLWMGSLAPRQIVPLVGNGHYLESGDAFSPYFLGPLPTSIASRFLVSQGELPKRNVRVIK